MQSTKPQTATWQASVRDREAAVTAVPRRDKRHGYHQLLGRTSSIGANPVDRKQSCVACFLPAAAAGFVFGLAQKITSNKFLRAVSPNCCSLWMYATVSTAGAEGHGARRTSRNAWPKRCHGVGMPRYRQARTYLRKASERGLHWVCILELHEGGGANKHRVRRPQCSSFFFLICCLLLRRARREQHERGPQAGENIEHRGCGGMLVGVKRAHYTCRSGTLISMVKSPQ